MGQLTAERISRFSFLYKVELLLCLAAWSSAVLFAGYEFFLFCQKYGEKVQYYTNVNPSKLFPKILQDRGDFEWNYWKVDNFLTMPCLLLRVPLYMLSARNLLPPWLLVVYDLTACSICIGFYGILFQIQVAILFFAVALANKPMLIWILAISISFLRYTFPLKEWLDSMGVYDHYRVECSTCYFVVRCISFAYDYSMNFDKMESQPWTKTFYDYVRYLFFLPLYSMGPITPFKTFIEKSANPTVISKKRFVVYTSRIVMCAALFEFLTHFFYAHSVRYYAISRSEELSNWAIAGNAALLGNFFQLKYMFFFGLFSLFSCLNGVDAVQWPICVTWVHKYSLMWKYFDHGLYVFLKNYIYIPFAEKRYGKIICTAGCYVFVLFWHGFTFHMFCWVGMNFAALLAEDMIYRKIRNDRLRAAVNTPLFMFSVVSNMFFLGESYGFGKLIFRRIVWENSPINVIGVVSLFYCASLVGDVWEVLKYGRRSVPLPAKPIKTEETGGGDYRPAKIAVDGDMDKQP